MGGMEPSPRGGSPKGLGAPPPARCPIMAANGLGGSPAPPPELDPDGVESPGAPPNVAKGLNPPMDPELPPIPGIPNPGNMGLAKKKKV